MRELNFLDADVDFEPLSQHPQGPVTDLVVAHVQDLEVSSLEQALLQGGDLLVGKLVPDKVEFADGDHDEELGEHGAADLVVVDVKFRDLPPSDRLDEGHGSVVVNIVVLEVDFFQSRAAVD